MKTFIANLQRAVANREHVTIGGGIFTTDELKAVVAAFTSNVVALKIAAARLEGSEDAADKNALLLINGALKLAQGI